MKVFIGGSKQIGKLSEPVKQRIDAYLQGGCEILIGDCHGADFAVQRYLDFCGVRSVTVYCSGSAPRNNVGGWNVIALCERGSQGYEFYRVKDIRMAQDADCGLMIWNGISHGTKQNIAYLQGLNKPVEIIHEKT